MNTINCNNTNFTGKFSNTTLAIFKNNLSPSDFKEVKNFRFGKPCTNIDIITLQNEPVRVSPCFAEYSKSTYADFYNSRKPNGAHVRVKIADGNVPLDKKVFELFTPEFVENCDNLLTKCKSFFK